MYVRPPADIKNRVNVPENYSGHAFRERSYPADMPPPKHIDSLPHQTKTNSDYPTKNEPLQINDINTPPAAQNQYESENSSLPEDEERRQNDEHTRPSLFSSLLPTISSGSKHFPFGHGIGSEEILLLAIMLLVFLSGNREGDGGGDDELLLLLGFLLFAG
jgi:hypothetical protein